MMTEEKEQEPWRGKYYRKMHTLLDPHEPAWLVAEEVHEEDEVVYFTFVHRWKPQGWARRRYTYDITADVMHFRGSTPIDDSELVKMKPEQRITRATVPR